jgi:hypothetical protein
LSLDSLRVIVLGALLLEAGFLAAAVRVETVRDEREGDFLAVVREEVDLDTPVRLLDVPFFATVLERDGELLRVEREGLFFDTARFDVVRVEEVLFAATLRFDGALFLFAAAVLLRVLVRPNPSLILANKPFDLLLLLLEVALDLVEDLDFLLVLREDEREEDGFFELTFFDPLAGLFFVLVFDFLIAIKTPLFLNICVILSSITIV